MQHSRRRWINSCFLFGGGSWGKHFSKNIFGLVESKTRRATSLFNFFFFSASPFGAEYMYFEMDSASEKKWTEGEIRQERANHKSIQPFFFSSCLLVSNPCSFLQGAKAPRLRSLMLRGSLATEPRRIDDGAERIDDGWQRGADSLIKYGLIGMGFSCHCVYLLYKYQVRAYGEWKQRREEGNGRTKLLKSTLYRHAKPGVNAFLVTFWSKTLLK